MRTRNVAAASLLLYTGHVIAQFHTDYVIDPFCEKQCPGLKDHFSTLGVNTNASKAELKRSCRSLLARNHPDKYSQKSAATKDEALSIYHEVQEACEQLGVHKTGEADDPASGSVAQKLTDYINKLKLCRECEYQKTSRRRYELGSHGIGFDDVDETEWAIKLGPGVVGREEVYTDGTRKFKRKVVCKSNTIETVCQDLEFELIGGSEWLEDPTGWSAPYIPEAGSEDDLRTAAQANKVGNEFYDPYVGAGEYLQAGAFVTSVDGSHFAMMTSDGNFGIWEGSGPYPPGRDNPIETFFGGENEDASYLKLQPIWETSTYSSFGAFAVLQTDGNFVIKEGQAPGVGETGNILWSSNKRVEERATAVYEGPRAGHYETYLGGKKNLERRVYAMLEDSGNFAVMALEEIAGELDCIWASVRCSGDFSVSSGVRAMKNAMRLSVKRVNNGILELIPGNKRKRSRKWRAGHLRRWTPKIWMTSAWMWLREHTTRAN